MFSFFCKKTPAKWAVLMFLLPLLMAGLLFVSCEQPSDDPVPTGLIGVWVSYFGEEYTISDTEFSYQMPSYGRYRGTVVGHRSNGSGAGYITIQYTENDWDSTAIGKYYVIHYKNLTASGVSIAGSSGGGEGTQAEAESKYTVTGGYFEMYSDTVKN